MKNFAITVAFTKTCCVFMVCLLQSVFSGNMVLAQHDGEKPLQAKHKQLANGIAKISYGTPEEFTPYRFVNKAPMWDRISQFPQLPEPRVNTEDIQVKLMERGCIVEIPLEEDEQIFGFGLQINSFRQNNHIKWPVVNSHPLNNLGLTHAPCPLYVSTKGYMILINTARYATFYMDTEIKKEGAYTISTEMKNNAPDSEDELYGFKDNPSNLAIVDIPNSKGVEIYIFEAEDIKSTVQKYILFSGGGTIPPLWGLGIKYRVKNDFTQAEVVKMADYFRNQDIPCDVLGLEPNWHTANYPCSYVWNKEDFPKPASLLTDMNKRHFKMNLWEHAYVHSSSPLFKPLLKHSGDYLVWTGLVPDFIDETTREIFGNYHDENLVSMGISGFKLDECDNSRFQDATRFWGFPSVSSFPSGVDGEQMHQLFGSLYQMTINNLYVKRNLRTYLDVRSSNAFMSSVPAVIYSDIYEEEQYVRMVANSGFSGLLWSPEVRHANSDEELIRRSQLVMLSAQALFNAWYLKNPPWLQYDREKNNEGQFLAHADEMENIIRTLCKERMSLVPYLYSAFASYRFDGVPPFRALVMDYPDDENVFDIYDQFMIGDNLMAVPLRTGQREKEIYLPKGTWYDYNTNKKYEGGKTHSYTCNNDDLPLFVKSGTLLPWAEPLNYVTKDSRFIITARTYGENIEMMELFEDDGHTYDYENGAYNRVSLSLHHERLSVERDGDYEGKLYEFNPDIIHIK